VCVSGGGGEGAGGRRGQSLPAERTHEVDAAVGAGGVLEDRRHLLWVGNVALDHRGGATGSLDLSLDRLERVHGARGEHDLDAGRGQVQRRRSADTTRSARMPPPPPPRVRARPRRQPVAQQVRASVGEQRWGRSVWGGAHEPVTTATLSLTSTGCFASGGVPSSAVPSAVALTQART
jgi:hypothetical protein